MVAKRDIQSFTVSPFTTSSSEIGAAICLEKLPDILAIIPYLNNHGKNRQRFCIVLCRKCIRNGPFPRIHYLETSWNFEISAFISNIKDHRKRTFLFPFRACSYGETFPGIFLFHRENHSAEVMFFDLSHEKISPASRDKEQ